MGTSRSPSRYAPVSNKIDERRRVRLRLPGPKQSIAPMDSFELNKILGAILAICIVLLSVHLIATAIFAPVQPAKPGFQIAVKEQPPANATASKTETVTPIGTRLAKADADRGKAETKVCMTCHTLEKDGPNKIGPNLWGLVDRPIASHPGFDYSAAMKGKGGKWTFNELDKFLAHPQGYIPGTKMTFSGIQNADQRANLIAYLRTQSDNPVPLPEAAAPASAGSEQEPSQQTMGSAPQNPK
jgi:cytochrome c